MGAEEGAEAAAVVAVDAATVWAGVAAVVAAGVGDVPADEHAAANIMAARAKPPRRRVPLINLLLLFAGQLFEPTCSQFQGDSQILRLTRCWRFVNVRRSRGGRAGGVLRRIEEIAGAANGHEMGGVGRVDLDLGPQPVDVHVNHSLVGADAMPDVPDELLARKGPAWMHCQELQEGQLAGSQRGQPTVPPDGASSAVQLDAFADRDPVLGEVAIHGSPATRDREAADDFHRICREIHGIVEPKLKSVKTHCHGLVRAEQDSRRVPVRAQPHRHALEVAWSRRGRNEHHHDRLSECQGMGEGHRVGLDPHLQPREEALEIDWAVGIGQGEPARKWLGGSISLAACSVNGIDRAGWNAGVHLGHSPNVAAEC